MTSLATAADHLLKKAIDDELAWTPDVVADQIGVGVTDGAVVLSGQVNTYPEKQAAVRAALRAKGVTAVADKVVVEHHYGHLDDADIAREATNALRASAVVPHGAVTATVQNHHVGLQGTVPWNYQREAADQLVSGLPGVVAVDNRIGVAPTVPLSAADAERGIHEALARNARADARSIHAHITGTTIELTGTVQSWAEYRQASHAAWSVPGVAMVRNRIRVLP